MTTQTKFRARQQRDRLLILLTVVVVIAAWLYGYFTSGTNVLPHAEEMIAGAARVVARDDIFVGYGADGEEIVGYAAVGEAPGYGGPVQIMVGMDPSGVVTGVQVLSHRDSPGFFRLVANSDMLEQFVDRSYDSPFTIGEDIDAVSGATFSAEGVAASARQAIRQIADEGLSEPLPPERRTLSIGVPEIVLVLLFAVGYFGHKAKASKWKTRSRWASLLTGMVVLGFIYTAPLTIIMVTSLLSGYWPDWHNNLYWYLLIGGVLFVTIIDGKNPYCGWFCPFGAVQECLAKVTDAKLYRPRKLHNALKWSQRGLALTAVVLGLMFRRPGAAGYEPFGTLFDLQGSAVELAFLAMVLLASLITYRPFCNYLCPIDPVVDFIAAVRKWVREVWQTWTKKHART